MFAWPGPWSAPPAGRPEELYFTGWLSARGSQPWPTRIPTCWRRWDDDDLVDAAGMPRRFLSPGAASAPEAWPETQLGGDSERDDHRGRSGGHRAGRYRAPAAVSGSSWPALSIPPSSSSSPAWPARATAQVSRTLRRLQVTAAGFVLNRISIRDANPAFRQSVQGVERHLRSHGRTQTRSSTRTRTSSRPHKATPAAPPRTLSDPRWRPP